MAVRSPHLFQALRCFCLSAFALLSEDAAGGAEIPFAFEEHASPGRPPLYEYRPLVRTYVEARGERLGGLPDARIALEELASEPAAAIFARAHAEAELTEEQALLRTVVLPLLVTTAEGCGGFDWDDATFERAYAELERSLFRARRAYAAIAPLVGLSLGAPFQLGGGIRARVAAAGELAAYWPEARALLPQDFGREPDRLCVLELERELPARELESPDAPGEFADAITAVRLATAGSVAAGAVVFERLDWRPLAIRPMLPIAAVQPRGDPVRLDQVRGQLARDLLARLGTADEDPALGDALDRYELALFQTEPLRSEQLREALAALLGGADGAWAAAARTALLIGESGQERAQLLERMRTSTAGGSSADISEAVRKALVETLMHGDRAALISSLDEALLGIRPRPSGYFAAKATAASAAGPRTVAAS